MAPFWYKWVSEDDGSHPHAARLRMVLLIIVLLQLFLSGVNIGFNVYSKFDNSKKFKALGDSNIKLGRVIVDLGSQISSVADQMTARQKNNEDALDSKMAAYTKLGEKRQEKNQDAFTAIEGSIDQLKDEMRNVVEKQLTATNASLAAKQATVATHERVKQNILTGSDVIQVKKKDELADKKLEQAQQIKKQRSTYIWAWPWHPPGPVATPAATKYRKKLKK